VNSVGMNEIHERLTISGREVDTFIFEDR
jgi:hypothetical protein